MKRVTAALALLVCFTAPALADNPYVINRDTGGQMNSYKTYWSRVHGKYDRVVINGPCKSACTLLFGQFPLDKICITPRGSISFHAAYVTGNRSILNPKGVRMMRNAYPAPILAWVDKRHALESSSYTTMAYSEATKYIASCEAPKGFKKDREMVAIVHDFSKDKKKKR